MEGPEELQTLVRRYQLALERFNQADSTSFDEVNRVLSEAIHDLNQYIIDQKRRLGFFVHQETLPEVMRVS
jgi:hypothetical protein